jgi:succinate dehydrogenase/fumarate reductase flavoprotein subunit
MPGVYAAGECACVSVHGANRLGGNSLLETIVFGARSARTPPNYIKSVGDVRESERTLKSERDRIDGILARTGGERHPQVRKAINKAMSDYAFIFRNEGELKQGVKELREVREMAKTMTVMDKSKTFNTDLVGLLETEFLMDISHADDGRRAQPHRVARRAIAHRLPRSRRREVDEALADALQGPNRPRSRLLAQGHRHQVPAQVRTY